MSWFDWASTPKVGENILPYNNINTDSQKINGFKANNPASSIRVNTALRQSTLVTAALMNSLGITDIDYTSNLSTVQNRLKSKINSDVGETYYFDDLVQNADGMSINIDLRKAKVFDIETNTFVTKPLIITKQDLRKDRFSFVGRLSIGNSPTIIPYTSFGKLVQSKFTPQYVPMGSIFIPEVYKTSSQEMISTEVRMDIVSFKFYDSKYDDPSLSGVISDRKNLIYDRLIISAYTPKQAPISEVLRQVKINIDKTQLTYTQADPNVSNPTVGDDVEFKITNVKMIVNKNVFKDENV